MSPYRASPRPVRYIACVRMEFSGPVVIPSRLERQARQNSIPGTGRLYSQEVRQSVPSRTIFSIHHILIRSRGRADGDPAPSGVSVCLILHPQAHAGWRLEARSIILPALPFPPRSNALNKVVVA